MAAAVACHVNFLLSCRRPGPFKRQAAPIRRRLQSNIEQSQKEYSRVDRRAPTKKRRSEPRPSAASASGSPVPYPGEGRRGGSPQLFSKKFNIGPQTLLRQLNLLQAKMRRPVGCVAISKSCPTRRPCALLRQRKGDGNDQQDEKK